MAKHVDYYVSLNSPWTYLGSKRFEAIAQKHGADVTVWPVDFGSVFAVSGGLPLPKRAPQRQAYRMMELKRWRDHLGVKTTLEPKFFPANEVPAAKCVIALREQGRMADAIKVAHAVLAALWAEEKNTGDTAGDHRRLRSRRGGRGQGERSARRRRETRGLHQAGDRARRVRRALVRDRR